MTLIGADISYYQTQVTDAYTRQWLIFRCCDGDFLDPLAGYTADWCRGSVQEGTLLGWTAYVVYRPGKNAAILQNLSKITPLQYVEIDIESWGGSITGDHSVEINSLAGDIAAIVGQEFTLRYGNRGDLASIHPSCPSWLRTRLAAYGPTKPVYPNLIGWQYTNGQVASGARPLSSAPFGACDHNEIYLPATSAPKGNSMQFRVMQNARGNDVWAIGDTWAIYMSSTAVETVWLSMPDCLSAAVEHPDATHWDQYQRRIVLSQQTSGSLGEAFNASLAAAVTPETTELTALTAEVGEIAFPTAAAIAAAVVSALPTGSGPTLDQITEAFTSAVSGLTITSTLGE